jgi:hypothetical protein
MRALITAVVETNILGTTSSRDSVFHAETGAISIYYSGHSARTQGA